MLDRRCRLGLAARIEMIRRREAGESLRAIAAAMACSPSTVKTQCDRWAQADEQDRADFRLFGAAPSGAEVLSARAERRAGAADPRCPSSDELGADAADRVDWPASFDDLEGPGATWRFSSTSFDSADVS